MHHSAKQRQNKHISIYNNILYISHLFAFSLKVRQYYLTHRSRSGPGNEIIEGVLRIPQRSNIIVA